MEEIREASTVELMLGEHRGLETLEASTVESEALEEIREAHRGLETLEASSVESEMEEIREASTVELMLGGHQELEAREASVDPATNVHRAALWTKILIAEAQKVVCQTRGRREVAKK